MQTVEWQKNEKLALLIQTMCNTAGNFRSCGCMKTKAKFRKCVRPPDL